MKTNFTMKNYFLAAFAIMAVVISSCSKDDPAPGIDLVGKYTLTGSTLVDGNTATPDTADPLTIAFAGTGGSDLVIPVGDSQLTLFWTNLILSGAAPCTNQDPTKYTYQVDFQAGGKIEFICTSEGNTSTENLGTWTLSSDNKIVTITIASEALGQVIVKIENSTITDSSIAGSIAVFPMLASAASPIGADNVQFIAIDVTLKKAQ